VQFAEIGGKGDGETAAVERRIGERRNLCRNSSRRFHVAVPPAVDVSKVQILGDQHVDRRHVYGNGPRLWAAVLETVSVMFSPVLPTLLAVMETCLRENRLEVPGTETLTPHALEAGVDRRLLRCGFLALGSTRSGLGVRQLRLIHIQAQLSIAGEADIHAQALRDQIAAAGSAGSGLGVGQLRIVHVQAQLSVTGETDIHAQALRDQIAATGSTGCGLGVG
jgi:hypothetical protein